MIKAMLIAGAGGFIGTCGRFLVGRWSTGFWHGNFPLGTFIVNLIGCFLIGLFLGLTTKENLLSENMTILHITGFCGGFTTFSSFAADLLVMGQKGDWTTFVLYTLLSLLAGVFLVWCGRAVIQ